MAPRLPTGTSDPVSFTCTCPASSSSGGGLVLLFYRYFSSPPVLIPLVHQTPAELAAFHTSLIEKHNLGGKLRIANEGFNITVGGTREDIEAYMNACVEHWSFASLGLNNSSAEEGEKEKRRYEFFKPTTGGCRCVFGPGEASVKITSEITPMGVEGYRPRDWDIVQSLKPEEFHEKCLRSKNEDGEGKIMLLDVRNHYESRIGYFVDPRTGEKALRPGIRRFSQFPMYVKKYFGSHRNESGNGSVNGEEKARGSREIMGYCTGGIRCEKSMRFLAENIDRKQGDKVFTLKGGIAAYLMWMDEEIREGKKKPEDSLFKGKNYVFDARGSMGLQEGEGKGEPVSSCHLCGKAEDRLSKCRSKGCHLILVVCGDCEEVGDPRCCEDCRDLDQAVIRDGEGEDKKVSRPVCMCEKVREVELWGGERVKTQKTQARRKGKRLEPSEEGIDIRIKIID